MHWYFATAELQFVSLASDYHQNRLYHLLLLCHPLLLHRHHFITPLPTTPYCPIPILPLNLPPQPNISPPPPPPSCLHTIPLLLQSNFYLSLWHFTFPFYTSFVLSWLKTHKNSVQSSPFLFFPNMHFIFQGLVKKWLYPSVNGQGMSY
jgi:hypothetical protein